MALKRAINVPLKRRETKDENMGYVYAEIEIANAGDVYNFRTGALDEKDIRKTSVTALVDSGAYDLTINENIKKELNLVVIERQKVMLADESTIELEVVGPVEIRFENRSATTNAFVLQQDAEVLLGAIPMQALNILIDPRAEKLIISPANPKLKVYKKQSRNL
ncbi:MAG: hypothetical protein H7Z37_18305 [Pyrinomonadaceae bacterium]|nr:hypothetical protein [Pyrinomonadaceae bacterium]